MAKKKQVAQSTLTFKAETRKLFGKKLKALRKSGFIPANIYGPGFVSTAISIPFKEFVTTYKVSKETGVITMLLEKKEIPVLVKQIQRHPVEDTILHVDFRKIDLHQKLKTNVPIQVKGESPAVNQQNGVLLTLSNTLVIEALPQDIPPSIEIDISTLKEIGQEIKVSNLPKSTTYEIVEPDDKVIVSVVVHKEESVTPETTAPVTEVIAEEKTTEGVEVAPAAEEKPVEKTKQEPPTSK